MWLQLHHTTDRLQAVQLCKFLHLLYVQLSERANKLRPVKRVTLPPWAQLCSPAESLPTAYTVILKFDLSLIWWGVIWTWALIFLNLKRLCLIPHSPSLIPWLPNQNFPLSEVFLLMGKPTVKQTPPVTLRLLRNCRNLDFTHSWASQDCWKANKTWKGFFLVVCHLRLRRLKF